MKKIIVLLLVLILVISGCGSKEAVEEKAEEAAIEKATEEAIEALGEDVEVETEDGTTTITTEDGGELTVAMDLENGVDVPDDYPEDVLPIYSEEYIALATNTDGSFSLSGYTNDSLADVIEYYEDAVKDGIVMIKEMDEEYYMNMGELMGQTYSINLMPAEDDTGYTTNFTLVVMPSMGALPDEEVSEPDEEAEDVDYEPSEAADLVIPADVDWPSDYPDKALPVYPTGACEVDIVEAGGGTTMVGLKTEDPTDVVYEYYKELFSGSDDLSEMNMAPMTLLEGTIDGQHFNITLVENGAFTDIDLKFKTLIQIDY